MILFATLLLFKTIVLKSQNFKNGNKMNETTNTSFFYFRGLILRFLMQRYYWSRSRFKKYHNFNNEKMAGVAGSATFSLKVDFKLLVAMVPVV